MSQQGIRWPDGRQFAFTIVDDTDRATVANASPVYDLLFELGLRTTKTVWPLRPIGPQHIGGQSLQDVDYRRWIGLLQERGFEYALHGVSDGSSTRDRVIEGLDHFRDALGSDPALHVNHVGQAETLYCDGQRFDQPVRTAYELARRVRGGMPPSSGHDPGSPHFWGDVCRERLTFVRNLVFPEINTLGADPLMPYHDVRRPYVPYWFSASSGSGIARFCRLISEENQDRLLEEGGACIVYTHFGSRFDLVGPSGEASGRMERRFTQLLGRLAGLPGWFVPASTLLRHLGEQRGWTSVGRRGRRPLHRMERQWLLASLLHPSRPR